MEEKLHLFTPEQRTTIDHIADAAERCISKDTLLKEWESHQNDEGLMTEIARCCNGCEYQCEELSGIPGDNCWDNLYYDAAQMFPAMYNAVTALENRLNIVQEAYSLTLRYLINHTGCFSCPMLGRCKDNAAKNRGTDTCINMWIEFLKPYKK